MTTATVSAHPNIALIKYWGKKTGDGNIPATPSVSATLDNLTTTTTVLTSDCDSVSIDGKSTKDGKILTWLKYARNKYQIPPIDISSQSNFPSRCGLASSASGFVAMSVAINHACNLKLDFQELAELTRRGSVSAARSMLGGFVSLDPSNQSCAPEQLHAATHWPMKVVVAVTDPRQKRVPSTEGMQHSVETSDYYPSWKTKTLDEFRTCQDALARRDFKTLSQVAESSCCRMHALMLSSKPPLIYWNSGTLAVIDCVRTLQQNELAVFFTIDAGPQVKVFCLPSIVDVVEEHIANTPGVAYTLRCGIGSGPTIV